MNSSSQISIQPVASLSLDSNIAELSRSWRQRGILHRVVEEDGQQVIYAEKAHERHINQDLQAFLRGDLSAIKSKVSVTQRNNPENTNNSLLRIFIMVPVTAIMIVLSIFGFLVVELNFDSIVNLMVIQSVDNSAIAEMLNLPKQISINEFLAHGHYWRLVTPIFLHFGWVHIVFNMLWLWELGRRIEVVMGSIHVLMVMVFVGIASNMYQTFSTPLANFGGMSGVIYGLLGYCGVFTLLAPHKDLRMPIAIYVLMLGSLLVGYSGIFDFLAMMANTAHLTGLIFGILIAIPSALIYRFGK